MEGTLTEVGSANAVKEQVDQNKENQRIPAQATPEANEKIHLLKKQTAQLCAALVSSSYYLQEVGPFRS